MIFLAHHGIKGQTWGVRNGPPYPLSAGQHSAKERKADWKSNLESNKFKKASGSIDISKDAKFRLTEKQKRAIKIGAAIAATALISYGGYKLYKSGALDQYIDTGNAKASSIIGKQKPQFVLTPDNLQQCASNINPTRSNTNCGSCAATVVQNMMDGGHREALSEVPSHMRITRSDGSMGHGYDPDKLIQCFDGAKWNKITGLNRRQITKNLEDAIIAEGEGSKGIFYCEKLRGFNSGHYYSWVVQNGIVKVVEGQASNEGIVWANNLYDDVGRNFDPIVGEITYARLDNHPIIPGKEKDLFKV